MKPQQIWDLFDWFRGTCFRCEAVGVPVAIVGEITARETAQPLYACHLCIFRMQQSHWFALRRRAWPLEQLQLPPRQGRRVGRAASLRWLNYRKKIRA